MDPITHGLIGGAASQALSKKKKLRTATVVGAVSAMLPDLDVLLGDPSDPLLNLELHRQFTHSFLFIPFGAFIATLFLWWIVRRKLNFTATYAYSLLGFATAGLADAFTSYGVQLYWPFTDARLAWNVISVFDPLFSTFLALAVMFAIHKKKASLAWLGLLWIGLYLSFGLFQKNKAHDAALKLAGQRNHTISQLTVKPTIGNELLWSIRYVHGDSLYADAVRLLPFAKPTIYEGQATGILPWKQEYESYTGTVMYKDIQRFSRLSENILITHPDHPHVIGDGRYAMLPTSISPLWGIGIDTLHPNQHVDFNTYRNTSGEVREQFKELLLGNRQR